MVKIPKSIEKEREFWDKSSITEFLDELELTNVKFVRKSPMVTLSFRIEEEKARELKALAKKMNIPYSVFIRKIIDKVFEKAQR